MSHEGWSIQPRSMLVTCSSSSESSSLVATALQPARARPYNGGLCLLNRTPQQHVRIVGAGLEFALAHRLRSAWWDRCHTLAIRPTANRLCSSNTAPESVRCSRMSSFPSAEDSSVDLYPLSSFQLFRFSIIIVFYKLWFLLHPIYRNCRLLEYYP